MNIESLKFEMAEEEKHRLRGLSALELIDLALEHDGRSAKSAALIILSLEANNWFQFSAVELIHLDPLHREYANNVLLGVSAGDYQPSAWLRRLDIDVTVKINDLIEKWSDLRV